MLDQPTHRQSSFSHGSAAPPPAARAPRRDVRPRLRRASFFLHEPLAARPTMLRAGVIADGTTRGGPNGIAQGAKRVVELAERCAERGDVELLAVFILSPKNLRRRRRAFFAALHAEHLRLLEGVTAGRLLAGIRVEVSGRLDRLRARGGAAAALAEVLDLLQEATRSRSDARMRLVLGVDYGEEAPVAMGLDVLIRTGMEEPSVLRLSGLRVRPGTICVPSTKLFRDFAAADLDGVLAEVPRAPRLDLAPGFSGDLVEALLAELSGATFSAKVELTVPIATSCAGMATLLTRAARALPPRSGSVSVTAAVSGERSRRRAGPSDAPVLVRLIRAEGAAPPKARGMVGWLVPGQSPQAFRLLERSAGDANVHACDPTPGGIVDGLRRALRFHEEHPPLHGAPRASCRRSPHERESLEGILRHLKTRGAMPAEVVARELAGGREPEVGLVGQVFAAMCLLDARSSGLISGEVAWERQALGYALTAFAVAFEPSAVARDLEGGWEPRARALAQVMLALAASDEEISDRVFDGETKSARRARLRASVEYLHASIFGEPGAVPGVPGARVLASIARVWGGFFRRTARCAGGALRMGVRRAAAALYRANLAELSPGDGLFARLRRARSLDERTPIAAPDAVVRRLRELLVASSAETRRADAWREVQLLCRLVRVAPSIGAGCALLSVAASEPEDATPAGAIGPLLRAASLIDFYFRLMNDLAFTDLARGDRDRKPTTFTCLVPRGLRGETRERARLEALRTCLTTAAWLRAEIERELAALWQTWPLAARWWQRGVHFGRRVYESGHYESLTSGAALDILAEVASLSAPPVPLPDGEMAMGCPRQGTRIE